MISGPLFPSLDDSKISPGYRSDHSLIRITVDINKSTEGHSYWTFNNSFLKDPIYVHKIKETSKQTKLRYPSDEQDSQLPLLEINNNDLKFNISDKLFLETLLLDIRGETISYASFIKRQQINRQEMLEKEINDIINCLILDTDKLEEKNRDIQEFRKKMLRGQTCTI